MMGDDVGQLRLLASSDLFRGLDEASLEAIAGDAASCAIACGLHLLDQDDEPSHLFVVMAGRFKMTSLNRDGTQLTLRFMDPGDVIGCGAVFRRFPYPASAIAVEDSAVLRWTTQQFGGLLRRYPQVATNVLAIVADRAHEMVQRLHGTGAERPEQRLARALLRLVDQSRAEPHLEQETALTLSRQDLAELSNTTIFIVSRVVSDWTRANVVTDGRGCIVVRDFKRLMQIAEDGALAAVVR
jgi:CRP-like cAMP-binding protein